MEKVKVSVLMPVRNEGVNLKIILKILQATIEVNHETLIVYDTNDDDSIPVVKNMWKSYPQLRLIHNKLGKGVVNAVKAGINAAKGKYILIITADDIGPVLSIGDMVELMDKGCELVSATRYAYGGRILGGKLISRVLSRISNKFFHTISKSSLTDSTIGIKMFRPSIFKKIRLEAKPIGWAFALELAIKAQLKGLKLGEVPIISINRFYGGKSSFKIGPWAGEYTKWFLWGLKTLYLSRKTRINVSIKIPKKIGYKRK